MGMVLALLFGLSAQASVFTCDVTPSGPQSPQQVVVDPAKPFLQVRASGAPDLTLIDETYLGLLTEPATWALRNECQLKQTFTRGADGAVTAVQSSFYCLLEDEATPIGKVAADLVFDYAAASGTYSGVSAPIDWRPAEVEKFELKFSGCRAR